MLNNRTNFHYFFCERVSGDIWIGLFYNSNSTSNYAWTNGEQLTFSNWTKKEPNNIRSERCVRLKSKASYQFATWKCSTPYHFLCKSNEYCRNKIENYKTFTTYKKKRNGVNVMETTIHLQVKMI